MNAVLLSEADLYEPAPYVVRKHSRLSGILSRGFKKAAAFKKRHFTQENAQKLKDFSIGFGTTAALKTIGSSMTGACLAAAYTGCAAGKHEYLEHYKTRCEKARNECRKEPFFLFDRERLRAEIAEKGRFKGGLSTLFNKSSYDRDGIAHAAKAGLKSAGMSLAGAASFMGLDKAADYVPEGFFDGIINSVKNFFSGFSFNLIGSAVAEEAPIAPKISEDCFADDGAACAPEDIMEPELEPIPEPTSTERVAQVLKNMDTTCWDPKVQSDLFAARAGQDWAIQNIAHYAAQGVLMPQDLDLAKEMSLIAKDMDYNGVDVDQFLKDLEHVPIVELSTELLSCESNLEEVTTVIEHELSIKEISAARFEALSGQIDLADLDEDAAERWNAALAGKASAIQDFAHYAAQVAYAGGEEAVHYHKLAEQLADIAQEAGYRPEYMEQFITDLKAINLPVQEAVPVEMTVTTPDAKIEMKPESELKSVVEEASVFEEPPAAVAHLRDGFIHSAFMEEMIQPGEYLAVYAPDGHIQKISLIEGSKPKNVYDIIQYNVGKDLQDAYLEREQDKADELIAGLF